MRTEQQLEDAFFEVKRPDTAARDPVLTRGLMASAPTAGVSYVPELARSENTSDTTVKSALLEIVVLVE